MEDDAEGEAARSYEKEDISRASVSSFSFISCRGEAYYGERNAHQAGEDREAEAEEIPADSPEERNDAEDSGQGDPFVLGEEAENAPGIVPVLSCYQRIGRCADDDQAADDEQDITDEFHG